MLKRQSKGENISDHLIATENWDEWKLCGIIPIHFLPRLSMQGSTHDFEFQRDEAGPTEKERCLIF